MELDICDRSLLFEVKGTPRKKMIHIKPKDVAAGVARRNIFGFYYFLQIPKVFAIALVLMSWASWAVLWKFFAAFGLV
jgi:hypothetical protein